MKKIIPCLVTLMLIWACEKPVTDIDIPPSDERMVVSCFLTPGDTDYEVRITLSQPIYNTENSTLRYVEDAKVFIISDGVSVELLYDPQGQVYRTSTALLPVTSGHTYQLEVNAKDGKKVTAACSVPVGPLEIDTVEFFERREDQYSTVTRIQARWADKRGEKNYYRLYIEDFSPGSAGSDTFYREVGNAMMNDENLDGGKLSAWCETYSFSSAGSYTYYDVYLLATDEHYYKYHAGRLSYQGDNPFAEPNIIYSNINGGLGCFGSYIKVYKRVKREF